MKKMPQEHPFHWSLSLNPDSIHSGDPADTKSHENRVLKGGKIKDKALFSSIT